MKFYSKLILLFLAVLVLQHCNENEMKKDVPGKVRFSFQSGLSSTGGRLAGDIPEGSYVLISIDLGGSETSYDNVKLQLFKSGDSFVSEPFSLAPGAYSLEEFMVVSPDHEVLYAAPKVGSELAHLVDTPLPIIFNMSSDDVLNLPVEVVNVTEATPEDFGYVSFNLDIVSRGSLQLSVFIPEDGGLKLTSAAAIIMREDDTVAIQPIGPEVNVVTYNGRSDEEFTLVVVKDGYARYATNFTADGLAEGNEGKPLTVVLEPAITFVATVGENHTFSFGAKGPVPYSRLETDFGNGSHTSNSLTEDAQFIEGIYEKSGKYFISNTGDIDKVTGLFNFDFNPIERLDVSHAPELQFIEINSPMGPATVDLTHNKKVETINLKGEANLEDLKINPDNNQVKYLNLIGATNLSSEAMDQIIYNLYHSVVDADNDRTKGVFFFSVSQDQPDVMVVTPSDSSLEMLRDLRDNYGWTITPDPM